MKDRKRTAQNDRVRDTSNAFTRGAQESTTQPAQIVQTSHPPTPSLQDSLFSEWATLRILSRGASGRLKTITFLTRPTLARRDAPCPIQGRRGEITGGVPSEMRDLHGAIREHSRRLLKKFAVLTRPTPARQDAP